MPFVSEVNSKNARAVHDKHLDLVSKYSIHRSAVKRLYNVARTQIFASVSSQIDLDEECKGRIDDYLVDTCNLFRFFRRSRYDESKALDLLTATVVWRIRTGLDLVSIASLHPLYVAPEPPNPPLFWVNSRFRDFYGRPCAVVSLKSLERDEENRLDQLRECIVASMEIMRRYVGDLYRESSGKAEGEGEGKGKEEEIVLQASIAVDLASSGIANLELELLPFLLDLLKNHVPGMVGAVYVLNYGWVHAGMWVVIKRVLPQQALAKIFFPSHDELKEHFDAKNIPRCYGGELEVEVDASSNDVLRRYGRPRRAAASNAGNGEPISPRVGQHMSRTNSYESIYEVFYSADSTPWASRAMTPRHSEPSTPRGERGAGAGGGGGWKMTPSAASKLKHLQMSRGDLSSAAAEHGYAGTGRARSVSDPRVSIVDGRAVGLSVSTGVSPFVTPAMTPVGPLSPRIGRSNPDRHVRFSSDREASSLRRVGATSNLKLYLPEQDEEALLPSESEDSDASGKDGELLTPPNTNQGGLLNRLRRLSETRFTSTSPSNYKPQDAQEKQPEAEGTIMYIDPTRSSAHLQVPHLDEPPLRQHLPHTLLSHRTRRSARDGLVSPYNANNPFFGYPAYNPQASANHPQATFRLSPSGTPQHLHSRRRKRDLLRTLTYLFVLRILALRRRLRWRFALLWRQVRTTFAIGANANANAKGEKGEKGGVLGKVGKKFLGAMVLLFVLGPEWRRRRMVRVYSVLVGMRDEGSVGWEEWERRGVPLKVDGKGASWTGLHVGKRLGIISDSSKVKVSRAAASGGKGKAHAINAIAIAGGLVSAAGLAYLLYNYLPSSSTPKESDDDDVSGRRGSLKSTSSSTSRIRPSLSLSLSPTFMRDQASISDLRTLLTTLSPLFVIHVILPGSEDEELSASISSLIHSLSTPTAIPELDARRILEYTRSSGRFALSRALACDCHVEVSLPGSRQEGTVVELGKLRTSCAFVLFASFQREDGVLQELRRQAREEGREDAPSGMGVIDLSSVEDGWVQLGATLKALRNGWKSS
ncbi:uncharacterized protein UBRO_05626 [Ustilago bromivora]|uniref:CRAL-TRIO domain-containing protein n=1 Tax=Ustilago bromivora TaxID=307758 RepID=A0A1K0HHZ8_9BASI|nr:uncharacterized protein UBRO_05626 [Ustilago bromivora]SYW83239.1 uncharacterized protein UBRO2_05130 [Ustilago bromivora]